MSTSHELDIKPLNGGLPPTGLDGNWIGWDAQDNPYLLRWHEKTQMWRGIGWEPGWLPAPEYPVVFATTPAQDTKDRIIIVRHRALR